MKLLSSRKGYTLIELLVVIGILGVLATITIPIVSGVVQRARLNNDRTTAKSYQTAISLWMSEQPTEDIIYYKNLSSSSSIVSTVSQIDYTRAYMGTQQLPGTEFTSEKAIRHATITAIESLAMENFDIDGGNLLVPHPESSGYGYKYYYKTGVVSLEKVDSTQRIYPDEAYDYYIWLDYDSTKTPSVKSIVDTSNPVAKFERNNGKDGYDGEKETFKFTFSIDNTLDIEKCVFTVEDEKNSYTLSGKSTTPQVFVAGIYRIRYYYAGELRADEQIKIEESEILAYGRNVTISLDGNSSLTLCSDINLFTVKNNAITDYLGDEEIIFVPSYKNGTAITAIDTGAFNGCSAKRIILPSTITEIRAGAITNCPQLEYLLLPSPKLHPNCIYGNDMLTNIEIYIPSTMGYSVSRTVGSNAIRDCKQLNFLHFTSVYTYDASAFNTIHTQNNNLRILLDTSVDGVPSSVANLSRVSFKYTSYTYFDTSSMSQSTYFSSTASTKATDGETLAIPSRFYYNSGAIRYYTKFSPTTTVTTNALKVLQSKFSSLELAEGYTEIGDDAFKGFKFSSITLPSTLETIGERAFSGNNCVSIELPQSIKSIGSNALTSETLETVIIRCDAKVLTTNTVLSGCTRVRTILIYNYTGDQSKLTAESFGLNSSDVNIVFA